MANRSKKIKERQKPISQINTTLIILLIISIGWAVYETTKSHNSLPTKSRLAYVDGNDAVNQVSNFYRQYISDAHEPDFQKKLIAGYGDQNLSFYDQYYQHGFDPITCSTIMPTNVATSLVSTGPVAIVKARATYPDHTNSMIIAKVVLTNELQIDSITCPGAKSNLPPKSID